MADEYTERLVRLIVHANDPMRGVPIPPPPVSATQLRLAAQRRSDTANEPAAGRSVAAGGAGVAMVSIVVLLAAFGAVRPEVPVAAGTPVTLAQLRPVPPMCQPSASATVRADAGNAAGAAGPGRQVTGPQRRVLTEVWTGGPAPLPSGWYTYFTTRQWVYAGYLPADRRHPVEPVDIRRWQATNGSAFGVATRDLDVDEPGYQPVSLPFRLPPRAADPSTVATAVDDWSSDPAVLATHIAAWDPDDHRPTDLLEGIAIRYRTALPTPAQHAAPLAVLCTTPAVRLLGPTTDRAGRPGIAVTTDHHYSGGGDAVQHATLILDPHT